MALHKVSITGVPPACMIEIDGQLIRARSADLHLDPNSLPLLTIAPVVYDLDVETEAVVRVDEKTKRTLQALGWTPPPDGQL